MAYSGIDIDELGLAEYNKLQQHREGHKQLLVYEIVDRSRICMKLDLCQDVSSNENFIQFFDDHSHECYFLVHDFLRSGGNKCLVFVMWTPDVAANPWNKMLYASSKEHLVSRLNGLKAKISANALDEVTISIIESAIDSN